MTETVERPKQSRAENLAGCYYGIVAVSAVVLLWICAGLFFFHIYGWLKTGRWKASTVEDGLEFVGLSSPKTGMVGLQRIIDWIVSAEMWWALPVYGFIIFIAIGFLTEAVKGNAK